jgi:zinc protease
MPGRSQVEIRLGGPSIARSDGSYPAAFLADEVLGGRSMISRLFQRIREQQGLAYHASSELETMRWGGYWMARAGTGAERLDRVARLLREEVERLSVEPIPDAELELVRESTIGELPLSLERTAGAHELAVDLVYHGLPDDFYASWPGTLRALSASDVRRAAERALDARSAVMVQVGPTG